MHKLTLQEAFDRIVLHLAAQGRRAMFDGGCVYRAENGDHCAVGVLISDEAIAGWEEYQIEMGNEVTEIAHLEAQVEDLYHSHSALLDASRIDTDLVDGDESVQNMYEFLTLAQQIHDNGYVVSHRPRNSVPIEEREEHAVASWPLWYDALGRWFGLDTESVQIAFGTPKVPDLTTPIEAL